MITENGKWEVTADQITYDADSRQYTATGNVVIVQGEKELRADRVVLNREDMSARAFGRVRLVSGNDRLTGQRLEMDMAGGTGTLYQGEVFIRENNFYIQGDRIEKTGENTYRIRRGSATTCQGSHPDWQITGNDVNVTIGGYGTVSHAAFWARQLPVFYVPWFLFPVKLERQTGLLAPQAGYSDRNGAEYIQPFFWAISKSSDATFYFHHLQERGEKFGMEYRYVSSKDSRGILMADGFEDRRIDDG
ncbi:MAG: LPS-assembly protein LptD, partial [Desulfobacterales bacterium]